MAVATPAHGGAQGGQMRGPRRSGEGGLRGMWGGAGEAQAARAGWRSRASSHRSLSSGGNGGRAPGGQYSDESRRGRGGFSKAGLPKRTPGGAGEGGGAHTPK